MQHGTVGQVSWDVVGLTSNKSSSQRRRKAIGVDAALFSA